MTIWPPAPLFRSLRQKLVYWFAILSEETVQGVPRVEVEIELVNPALLYQAPEESQTTRLDVFWLASRVIAVSIHTRMHISSVVARVSGVE